MSMKLVTKYMFAKSIVLDEGYSDEVSWQSKIIFDDIDESTFLREIAWVILSSGMREKVVRNLFGDISKSFFDWISAEIIVANESRCFNEAIRIFNNKPKISAIIYAANRIDVVGITQIKEMIREDPIETLQKFPFIGPVTVYHLAKNIGLPVAKPDRHLRRIATMEGYSDVQIFCDDISKMSGDSVPVVDIVLWRFATIENNYLNILSRIDESHECLGHSREVPYETKVIQ